MFNIKKVIEWVKSRYQDSEIKLPYHNIIHVMDVLKAAEYLISQEGISEEDAFVLRLAVLFHDIGLLNSINNHEEVSCLEFRKYVKSENISFSAFQDKVSAIIMATKLPQKPSNILEMIICDADLDNLHRQDFLKVTKKVYSERILLGDNLSWLEMLEQTRDFIEKHTYFTTSAQNEFRESKNNNFLKIKELIIAEKQ